MNTKWIRRSIGNWIVGIFAVLLVSLTPGRADINRKGIPHTFSIRKDSDSLIKLKDGNILLLPKIEEIPTIIRTEVHKIKYNRFLIIIHHKHFFRLFIGDAASIQEATELDLEEWLDSRIESIGKTFGIDIMQTKILFSSFNGGSTFEFVLLGEDRISNTPANLKITCSVSFEKKLRLAGISRKDNDR